MGVARTCSGSAWRWRCHRLSRRARRRRSPPTCLCGPNRKYGTAVSGQLSVPNWIPDHAPISLTGTRPVYCRTARKGGVSEKKGGVLAADSWVQKKRAARGVRTARKGTGISLLYRHPVELVPLGGRRQAALDDAAGGDDADHARPAWRGTHKPEVIRAIRCPRSALHRSPR